MVFSPRKIAAGAAFLLVYNLLPAALAPANRGAERGVRRTLIRLNELLARRDEAILDEFAADAQLVGSEAAETARGRGELEAFFKALFGRPETLAFAWRTVTVEVRGPVAWLFAAGELVVQAKDGEQRVPYRLTGVLEPGGHDRWIWRQWHGSRPVA